MSDFSPSLARNPQARPHPKGCAGMAGREFAVNAGNLRASCGLAVFGDFGEFRGKSMSIASRSDPDARPVQLQPSARLTGDQEAASATWPAQIEETDPATRLSR
jgi:hypothetical protein